MHVLSSAKTSILVNGSPTRDFNVCCGLKQGDLFSPFMFIIIMEALSVTMKLAKSQGLFRGLKLPGNHPCDVSLILREWCFIPQGTL